MSKEAIKLVLEALELAQDNLRDHGDNCFLHDEGEYNRCFCGKDSLSNHLQSVVEKLDEALNAPLAEQPAQQEPVDRLLDEAKLLADDRPVEVGNLPEWALDAEHMLRRLVKAFNSASKPAQRKPLTLGQKQRLWSSVGDKLTLKDRVNAYGLAIEAAHGIKGDA